MGSAAHKPSQRVGALLRKRRKELGLTLVEVVRRMKERGEVMPRSTLTRVEQGKLDPGTRRLHLLLRIYDIPADLVSDLVQLEALAVEAPEGLTLEELYREGIRHWRAGRTEQALANLFAVREYSPSSEEEKRYRHKATLAFAVTARGLGKTRLAKHLVEEVLVDSPAPVTHVRLLVLASSLWARLGAPEVALALIERAKHLLVPEDELGAAHVAAQRAKLLVDSGDYDEALATIEAASEMFERGGDPYNKARGYMLAVRILGEKGEVELAIDRARTGVARANELGDRITEAVLRIELGKLLLRSGDPAAALGEIGRAQGMAIQSRDKNAEFYAHYALWKVHSAMGNEVQAHASRQLALECALNVDDVDAEVEELSEGLPKSSKST